MLSNPQTLNPYVYSLNNPINLSDPSGEFWFKIAEQYLPTFTRWGQACASFLSKVATKAPLFQKITPATTKMPNIIIKSEEHAARHLEGTNLTVEAVEQAIKSDILSKGVETISKLKEVTIKINDTNLIYRPYVLEDGTISVGTYFIPK